MGKANRERRRAKLKDRERERRRRDLRREQARQATTAMVAAGSRQDALGRSRTRSFRQSFLTAYAQRIEVTGDAA